ncbi:MAG TPA: hypothetical protein VHX13_00865 [Acidobacteriaceae bacterium]|jgi:hypothetical protein|nr:hypothetical protein [Acidobacteriaceae bacterium]
MRFTRRLILRIALVVAAAVILWVRLMPHGHRAPARTSSVTDLSQTRPLNRPGGGPAPAEAYPVYSALYAAGADEPLVFAAASRTDIPQVGGGCLKPSTPEERAMMDAFVAANRESRTWQPQFTIPQGYRVLAPDEVAKVRSCLSTGGHDAAACDRYKGIRHVRLLGVPGFDATHTHALVSVIKSCGGFCGSGGIFEAEKTGGTWKRVATTDFTRDCSWIY